MTVETDRIHRVGIDRLFVVSPQPPHDLGCDGLQHQFGLCTDWSSETSVEEGSDSSHVKIGCLGFQDRMDWLGRAFSQSPIQQAVRLQLAGEGSTYAAKIS